MADTIYISPELLREKANTVRTYRSDHDQVMTNLTNLVNGLEDLWKGDAQNAFKTQYESMKPTFQKFSELLGAYATEMDNSANQMESQDQQRASQINAAFS